MARKKDRLPWFTRAAKWASRATGRPGTFILAVGVILVWAITGPLFGYSDTWQLMINTGTTIVTFLMVFLIQNTQNRDTQTLQIKLDELDEEELEPIRNDYLELAKKARTALRRGKTDTGIPDL